MNFVRVLSPTRRAWPTAGTAGVTAGAAVVERAASVAGVEPRGAPTAAAAIAAVAQTAASSRLAACTIIWMPPLVRRRDRIRVRESGREAYQACRAMVNSGFWIAVTATTPSLAKTQR